MSDRIVKQITDKLYPAPVEDSGRSAPEGWQPIETAPNDQEPILCGHPENGIEIRLGCAARFQNGGEFAGAEIGCRPYWHFTHWMPLPAPPRAALLVPQEEPKKT